MTLENQELLTRFRQAGSCEWCGQTTPGGCDPAHIIAKGMGGGRRLDHPFNLVSLCRRCHTEHHAGRAPKADELLAVASKRELWALIRKELAPWQKPINF